MARPCGIWSSGCLAWGPTHFHGGVGVVSVATNAEATRLVAGEGEQAEEERLSKEEIEDDEGRGSSDEDEEGSEEEGIYDDDDGFDNSGSKFDDA